MINSMVVKGACKAGLNFVKANAPTIMTGAGIAFMGAGTVLAVKASKDDKLNDNVAYHREKTRNLETFVGEMIESGKTPGEMLDGKCSDWTQQDAIQAAFASRIKLIGAYVKQYAPAATCVVAGVALILAGHGIMLKRNAALGLALEAVSTSYQQYRENVVEMLGEDADQQFVNGAEIKDVNTLDADTGKKKTVKKALVAHPTQSALDVWFSDANPNFSKNPAVNAHFLHACEQTLQNKVDYEGQLSWAEALKFMAFDKDSLDSAQAQKVAYAIGWKRGDTVNLGISELYSQSVEDPDSMFHGDVMLHPNCSRSMFDTKFLGVLAQREEQLEETVADSE